jgi:tetratricopeptide (TPR) repeat protein
LKVIFHFLAFTGNSVHKVIQHPRPITLYHKLVLSVMNKFRLPDKSTVRPEVRISRCLAILVVAAAICAGSAHVVAAADLRPTQIENGPEAILIAGDRAYNENRFQEAISLYTQAAKIGAPAGHALLRRGMAYEMINQPNKAEEDYKQAIETDPRNYKAMENLAAIWERTGKHTSEAIGLYQRALKLDPRPEWQENLAVWIKMLESRLRPEESSAVSCWHRGNDMYLRGDLDSARAAYSRAIALNPVMFQAYHSRGLVRMRQGDLAGALKDFDEAVRLSPTLRGCLIQRGLVLEQLENKRAAMEDFRRATEVDPRDPQAFFQLGRFLEQEGNLQEAQHAYQTAILLKPKPDLLKVLHERTAAVAAAKIPKRNAAPARSTNQKLW